MHVENGKIILGVKECYRCEKGQMAGQKPCSECKGTGRGKRGKVKGCKKCYGYKTEPDFENTVVCDVCNGDYQNVPESYYDYMPDEIWKSLEFKVFRVNKGMTFNEEYLALGYIFGCTDYGRAYAAPDEKVIEDVRNHSGHQAIQVCKEDGTLCKHIQIIVKTGGYLVDAVF